MAEIRRRGIGRIDGEIAEVLENLEAAREERLSHLLGRGPKVKVAPDLKKRLDDGRTVPGKLLHKPPSVGAAATQASDGSRTRVVLVKAGTTEGGVAGGAVAHLLADDGTTVLDLVRIDRRGLALLRFPHGTGADLRKITGKVRIGEHPNLFEVTVPADQQHAVLFATVDPGEVVDAAGNSLTAAAEETSTAEDAVVDATTTLADAAEALEEAAASLVGGDGSTGSAVDDAAGDVTDAAADMGQAATALADAAAALAEAATALASAVPVDSVVSRLPVSFSPALADTITRLLEVAEGPIPGLASSTSGISVSRVPLIKYVTVRRVIAGDDGRVRRFLVRIRQEWTFIGFTLGELVRVDPLDPASVTGTLDARLTARVEAGLTLDAATASKLQAALSGQLSAQAAVDAAIDVAVRTRFDSNLQAGVQAGIRNDPLDSFSSPGQFFGELGTSVLDFLLPDIGGEANASLNANLDVDAHTDLSVRSSLLAAARINAAASLVNQVRVRVSATLEAITSLQARLTAQINPSLARAVNLLRFVLYDVYAVTSRAEDVLEVHEETVFTAPPLGDLLFPPADIVDYRPFFQPRLLERRLAPHFDVLRRGLNDLRAGGEAIGAVHVLVEYNATAPGADLTVRAGGRPVTVRLAANNTVAVATIPLSPPVRPSDLGSAKLHLTRRDQTISLPWPFPDVGPIKGAATVRRVEVRYTATGDADDVLDLPDGALAVHPDQATASTDMVLDPRTFVLDLETDPLVVHIDRNKHYYLGVLAEAAIRLPSLRQDAPQLDDVPEDLWKLPMLGFEADRALLLVEPDPADKAVQQMMDDEGTSTIVQLAAAGLYTEVAQGRMQIAEVAGLPHPALNMPEPPLPDIGGLDVLSGAGGLGAPNLVSALNAASPLLSQSPGLPNLAALAQLVNAGRPPAAPGT